MFDLKHEKESVSVFHHQISFKFYFKLLKYAQIF